MSAATSPATSFTLRVVGSSATASTLATPWKASRERCSTGMTLMPEGTAPAAGPEPSGLGRGGADPGSRFLNRPPPTLGAFGSVVVVTRPSESPFSEAQGRTLRDARRAGTAHVTRFSRSSSHGKKGKGKGWTGRRLNDDPSEDAGSAVERGAQMGRGGGRKGAQPTGGTTHGTPANDRWCGPAPDAAGERVTATEGDTKGRTDPDGSRERGHERHRSRREGPRSAAELDMITMCGALAGAARSCRQQPGGKTVVISSRASIRRHVLADCSPSSSSGHQSQNLIIINHHHKQSRFSPHHVRHSTRPWH